MLPTGRPALPGLYGVVLEVCEWSYNSPHPTAPSDAPSSSPPFSEFACLPFMSMLEPTSDQRCEQAVRDKTESWQCIQSSDRTEGPHRVHCRETGIRRGKAESLFCLFSLYRFLFLVSMIFPQTAWAEWGSDGLVKAPVVLCWFRGVDVPLKLL